MGVVALTLLATSCEAPKPGTAFDFDGDGRADFAWIDGTGIWRTLTEPRLSPA